MFTCDYRHGVRFDDQPRHNIPSVHQVEGSHPSKVSHAMLILGPLLPKSRPAKVGFFSKQCSVMSLTSSCDVDNLNSQLQRWWKATGGEQTLLQSKKYRITRPLNCALGFVVAPLRRALGRLVEASILFQMPPQVLRVRLPY